MPLVSRDEIDENVDLHVTIARLREELDALRAQAPLAKADIPEIGVPGTSFAVNRIEPVYRAPKLPVFFKSDPALWFLQVEASFRNAGITRQTTMADTVVAHLDVEAVALISDLIESPDPTNQYIKIKDRIISTFAVSAESKLRQLLKGQMEVGGKPSQLLARMRHLSGSSCGDAVLRSMFLEHLPEQCRVILAASKSNDLQELAHLADNITDYVGQSKQSCAISADASSHPCTASCSKVSLPLKNTNDSLVDVLEKMSKQLSRLEIKLDKSRSRSRSSAPARQSRSRSNSNKRDSDGICRIHRKYGEKALHCYKPCEWKSESDSNLN